MSISIGSSTMVRVYDGSVLYIENKPPSKHWYAGWWFQTDERQTVPDTWAWVEGDRVFLPMDGQSTLVKLANGHPDPDAGWYDAVTGKPAILGLPGCTMSVML